MDFAFLLPLTSLGDAAGPTGCLRAVSTLAASMRCGSSSGPSAGVVIGLDEGDALHERRRELLDAFGGFKVELVTFRAAELPEHPAGCTPLCWMWNTLAAHAAAAFDPEWTLLLGDDLTVEPAGWPSLLKEFAARRPHLLCFSLLDAADPGFPSFPVVKKTHMQVFGGRMLPAAFVNQGGDPYLDALYRGFGASDVCTSVTVHNRIGGPSGCLPGGGAAAAPPRYRRRPISAADLVTMIREGRSRLASALRLPAARIQVAVAAPTFRADPAALRRIVGRSRCTHADVDVRFLMQVDNPRPSAEALVALRGMQLEAPSSLRIRINAVNQGAAAARNQLLDEAASCGVDYVIFFDDDVEPVPGCVDAYVAAFKAWPEAAAFAGPTLLPRQPNNILTTAISISGVSFFFEAPSTMRPFTPWAVTANLAVAYTHLRFRSGFPNTGGGEDVDFCIQLGHRVRCVPEAAVVHPWWPQRRPKIYMRFWGWAYGDGRLQELWPDMAYRRPPNVVELAVVVIFLVISRCGTPLQGATALAAMLAADAAQDVARHCLLASRRRQNPCHPAIRVPAAAESCVVKLFSEAGRLWGHVERGRWRDACGSFDWFCSSEPSAAVIRDEQRRALLRACVCIAAAYWAWGRFA